MSKARAGAGRRSNRRASPSFVSSGVSKRCRSPVGMRTRFCVALEAVLASESNRRRASVYVVEWTIMKTGSPWVAGVAARKGAKNRPVFFNCCPFCGADIDYFKRVVSRKVAL